ncbi:MAG: EpsG family protein [Lachnospiraceae bacterium]|nr:EpsG family protein [Lachnospiraceae bacterium]
MMYIFLIISLVCALFLTYISKEKHIKIHIGKYAHIFLYEDIVFTVLIIFLFLMWILKATTVGNDTYMYEYMYSASTGYLENGLVWQLNNQPLYYWTFAMLEKSGMSFRTAQSLFYLFACAGVFFIYKKYSTNKVLPLFFFVTCESMALYSSALRQMIAITFGIFAMHFILERKIGKALLFILFAILFHKTAGVLLILIILYFYVPSKKEIIVFTPLIWSVALILPTSIITKAAFVFGYEEYLSNIGNSSDAMLLAMYLCMGIFVLYMMYTTKWDSLELRYFTTLFVVSIAIILFSSKFYLLSRFQYYFQAAQYLVFAEAVHKLAKKKSVLLFFTIILLYIVFFMFSLNSDTLGITPYKFFWNAGEKWL